MCGWEPWSQAQCGSRVRIRVRVGRESKHRAAVGVGLERGSERKVQAPKDLSPDNLFISDVGLAFWKGSAVVPTGSVLLMPLGVVSSRLWGKQNSIIIIFNCTIPITISSLV